MTITNYELKRGAGRKPKVTELLRKMKPGGEQFYEFPHSKSSSIYSTISKLKKSDGLLFTTESSLELDFIRVWRLK